MYTYNHIHIISYNHIYIYICTYVTHATKPVADSRFSPRDSMISTKFSPRNRVDMLR